MEKISTNYLKPSPTKPQYLSPIKPAEKPINSRSSMTLSQNKRKIDIQRPSAEPKPDIFLKPKTIMCHIW
jgi:hypothetical protein